MQKTVEFAVLDRNASAMAFDNLPGDCKTKPRAGKGFAPGLIDAEEGLEYLCQQFGRHTGAVVFDPDYRLVSLARQPHACPATMSGGIGYQIAQRPFQGDGSGVDGERR